MSTASDTAVRAFGERPSALSLGSVGALPSGWGGSTQLDLSVPSAPLTADTQNSKFHTPGNMKATP
ncbi:hypothetical protein [Streptomyces rochei]|uniref:hypothetical protein n=1 Tax=Streptomyces rochei TaxID=1928 RepID=UPI00373EEAF7